MNHFFSQLVADKKIKRQIKLLTAIYEANYPITLDEIAEEFGTSKRTLFRDMKDLEYILPEDIIVEFSSISGYTVSNMHLIEDLVVQIAEQSPLYRIVNNVYDEIFLTIDEWADDLFLSTSTLYRYLGYLKKILKEFKLDLTLTPVTIVGDEVNIRHFYFHFLYNTNDISSMNRPTEQDREIFHRWYSTFIGKMNRKIATQHRSALYWIMVIRKRLEQGHTILLDRRLKESVRQLSTHKFMPESGQNYFPGIEEQYMTEDEFMYGSLLSLDNYVYEESETVDIKGLIDTENLEIINRFLVDAFKKLEKELPEPEIFSLYVMYLRNIYFLTQLTPLFQRNSTEVNRLIKHRHPTMYSKWLEILTDAPIEKKFGIEYIEDVAVNFAMFTYFSHQNRTQRKKHILFAFDGKKSYLNYLNVLVKSFINSNIEITFLVNQHITNKVAKELGVDIVIYNYKEDGERLDCIKYRTERMPTDQDWEKINNLIFDME
ncbi:helix-turn-helix domain-containing protein [Listeria rocourtiae]|uniref:helix-turn-helix domain-containing protein n=1 Tax=Listeria rocourtiae TaxID=647910 RepID=UPI003D2F98D2